MALRWIILTGEYPPSIGGVGHYSAILARALAEHGDEVLVYRPPDSAAGKLPAGEPGLDVRFLPDRFGLRSLLRLSAELRSERKPYRILLQYVPHNFGWKFMNVPFCLWLWVNSRKRIWVMFHEVCFPFIRGQSWRRNLLALVQHIMAFFCLRAASRVFVSCSAFKDYLQQTFSCRKEISVIPVFSNIPDSVDNAAVLEFRSSMLPESSSLIIGHFARFQKAGSRIPLPLARLLEREVRACFLFVGEHADCAAESARNNNPDLASRILAVSNAAAEKAAVALAACDLIVQPYPDGINGRHASLLASLALGKPIVTNTGRLSESFWKSSGAVALADSSAADDIYLCAEPLLANPELRREIAAKAAGLYREVFHLDRTLAVLYQKAEEDGLE